MSTADRADVARDRRRLALLQAELGACSLCPTVEGTPVHGPPVLSKVYLLGQAPGPREAGLGRPFAWTAGRTLFAWLEQATGASEERVRARVYFAAVARCFPGKAKGGGDRRPSRDEIERCARHVAAEVELLEPDLVLPVGTLAIAQVLGHDGPLAEVIGSVHRVHYLGRARDVIALPHPSGASTWHRTEPGKALLARALQCVGEHAVMRAALR